MFGDFHLDAGIQHSTKYEVIVVTHQHRYVCYPEFLLVTGQGHSHPGNIMCRYELNPGNSVEETFFMFGDFDLDVDLEHSTKYEVIAVSPTNLNQSINDAEIIHGSGS